MTQSGFHFARATTGYVTSRKAGTQLPRRAHVIRLRSGGWAVRCNCTRIYGVTPAEALVLVQLYNHLQAA